MVVVDNVPLLHGSEKRNTRKVVVAIAVACALVAVTAVVATSRMEAIGRASLLQGFVPMAVSVPMAKPQAAPMQTLAAQMPAMAQPVYYVPVSAAAQPAPAQGASLAGEKPVVYYYVPEATLKQPKHVISLAGNGTGGGNGTAKAEKPDFSCTVANIKAKAAPVLAAWDTCVTATDYEVPNKNAKRMLLNWVWEGKGKPNTPMPGTMLAGNASAGNASKGGKKGPTLSECEANATGTLCEDLAGCSDPVCTHYYNDPDIERICGVCVMKVSSWWGCFARNAKTVVAGRGSVSVGDLKVGDEVMAAHADGTIAPSRVYYIHDHKEESQTVSIRHSAGELELTPMHVLPVYSEVCGSQFCAEAKMVQAKDISAGDRIYVADVDGSIVQTVTSVTKSSSMVRYVLTEAETIVVGGVVASVRSTAAGVLETLPFRALDYMWKGALQAKPVAAALAVVLESPLLYNIEAIVNSVFPALSRPVHAPSSSLHLATPVKSF